MLTLRPVPVVAAALVLAACEEPAPPSQALGDPAAGRQEIRDNVCGACHSIPGIRTARGTVGPPLKQLGRRSLLAGRLPNTPENLVRWLRNPQAIEPSTAMPNFGLDERQARDIAAYLLTLR